MSLEAKSVHLSKNKHGKFRRFFFCGIFNRRKYTWKWIYEDSTIESKHILSIKLISTVIAVHKQTVFPISLNCPTIPYKNFGGYPWKKIEKNIHERG